MNKQFKLLVGILALGFTVSCVPPRCVAVDFGQPQSYPVGTNPSAVAVGDFNRDGKLDIAVANHDSNNVSILLGNGDGTFQPAGTFNAGLSPGSIAAADFDFDGKLDLVLFQPGDPTNRIAGAVSILLGDGDGTFQSPKLLALTATSSTLVVADFNLDARPDLAVSEFDPTTNAGTIDIFLGKGDGNFQAGKSTSFSAAVNGVFVVADFNKDQKPDVAVLVAGRTAILVGNGDGTFHQGSFAVAKPDFIPGIVMAADFNRDKNLDLLVISYHTYQRCGLLIGCTKLTDIDAGAFMGKGDGSFESELTLSDFKGGPIIFGDFNGDGKLDIGYRALWANLGRGDGTFAPLQFSDFAGDVSGFPYLASDLNDDKLDDLIILDGVNNAVSVALNTSPRTGSDLAIVSSCCDSPPAEPIGLGSTFTYEATVLNEGPLDASDATFTDTLPAGVSLVSAIAEKGTCVTASGIVSCTVGPLASAAEVRFTISLTANSAGTITNAMEVSTAETDPIPTNNVASQTNTIVPVYSLTVRLDGVGSGSIASSNGVIKCSSSGGTCTMAQVLQGTIVNLKASTAQGSVFAGWSGACSGTDPKVCSVTLNSDQSVIATFQPVPDFSVTPAAPSLSLQRGGQASEQLTFPAQGGFSGTIALACAVSGMAPMPTCSISPNSVSAGSSARLIVSAATLSGALISQPLNQVPIFYAASLPFGALGLVFVARFDKKRRGAWFLCLAILAAAIIPVACGGGGSNNPPPQGYNVTVTAQSGGLQHSTIVTVTVE